MKKLILLTVFFYFLAEVTYAQPGKLNPLFGNNGIVSADLGSPYTYNNSGRQVLIQPDGSLYIIFDYPFTVSKRLPNGSIDSTYGFYGYSRSASFAASFAAFQPDGKMVIVGSNGIARITANGRIDSAFGINGIEASAFNLRSVAIQKDGKIVVAGGNSDAGFLVGRYNTDGTIDPTFNGNGTVTTDFDYKIPCGDKGCTDSETVHSGTANSLVIQKNGQIIVAGDASTVDANRSAFAIARYNSNGSLDNSFGVNGKQTTRISTLPEDIGYSLALQDDEKIILAGYSVTLSSAGYTSRFAVVRYDVNGKPDNSFNGTGKQLVDLGSDARIPNSVAIQKDGRIVIAGYTLKGINNSFYNNDFAVVRLNKNGSPDSSFDKDGFLTTDFDSSGDYAGSVALQSDAKIVVAGYSFNISKGEQLAVSRYYPDGRPDSTFGNNGRLERSSEQGNTVFNVSVIQPDGKIVAAGTTWNGSNYDFVTVRYNADGSRDDNFNTNGKQIADFGGNDAANALVLEADGKIIVAGTNNNQFAVVRYNSDGSPDNTFNGDGKQTISLGFSDALKSVAVQADGKIVMAGYTFTDASYDSTVLGIAHLNNNGMPDDTFGSSGKKLIGFAFARSVIIQKNGKIVAAGRSFINGKFSFSIARYNMDGNIDTTFSHDGKQNSIFGPDEFNGESLAIQSDGKILAGGFTESEGGGSSLFALARYTVNGDLDSTFGNNGFQTTDVGPHFNFGLALAIHEDGRIALAGTNDNFTIVLYKSDGSIDSSFNNNGIKSTSIGTGGSRIQSLLIKDDKLYAVGYGEFPGILGVIAGYLLTENNNAPAVVLTSPSNNANFTAPANITLNAKASDADGTIVSVQFYSGSTLLKADSTTPYSCSLNNLAAGNYLFVAKAIDNTGLSGNSATVSVSVQALPNKAPVVSITGLANNATFISPAVITINAAASDPDGTISQVKFYDGSTLLATDSISPYTYTIKNASTGTYAFYAEAADNNGLKSTSSTAAAFVVSGSANRAPAISITSPKNNANYPAVATVVLHASASDADGTITCVKFYNGATLLKTDSTSPYNCSISHPPTGNYSFVAQAIDNNGLVSKSAAANVQVGSSANKAPFVDISAPVNNASFVASSAVILHATGSDPDGTISSVKFYEGVTLLKTVTSSPYNDTIKNVATGNYNFYAKATDNQGLSNSSASISIAVVPGPANKAPVIKLINPASNAIHYAPGSVFINADASDVDGKIATVKFYMGSVLVATDSTAPYSYTLTDLPAGNYTFTAKATDLKGLESSAATAAVSVLASPNKAPFVNIISPFNNTVYATPAVITLAVSASDPDGTIASVKFYNGSTLLTTVTAAPYSYTLKNAVPGIYKFYAKATDNNGLTNSTATVFVTVQSEVADVNLFVTSKMYYDNRLVQSKN